MEKPVPEAHPLLHLPRLLATRRQPVALRQGEYIAPARFAQDVGCALTHLQAHSAGACALYTQDAYIAAVWLIAALCAGRDVLLPGEVTPATVRALQAESLLLLGDWPGPADALREWIGPAQPLPDTLAPDARILLQTSGSTGTPKRVTKTLAQTEAETQAIEALLGPRVTAEAIIAGSVPHQHMYGLSFRFFWPLCSDRCLLAQALPGPETLWALPAGRPAVFVSSPALLRRLPDTLPWHELPRIECVLSAGSPLPAEAAHDAASKLGCAVGEIYGSTETGAIALRNDPDASWTLLPGATWQLADGDDSKRPLMLRAPWLDTPDWLASGDLAEAQGDSFRLCGRADRIAKVEDKRISLSAVETALKQLPEVTEARVLVLQGARSEVGAVIVLSEAGRARLQAAGKGALDRALRSALTDAVEPLGLPRRWRYLDALPQDSLGKTRETALAECFAPPRWPRVLAQHAEGSGPHLSLRLHLAIDADLAHFEGHFPGAPILPGVAQIDWAMHFARRHFALPPDCLRLEVVKFQQIIRPGMEVELQLDWQPERGSLAFEYRSGALRHASGRLILGQTA